MRLRLRHVAAVNPSTPEFDLLPDTADVPFLPLEAVWPGDRLDTTRRRHKEAVSTGYTRFREGDILVPKITPTFQADRTVIARGLEGHVGAGTTELHVVRVGPKADARYVRYLLSSKEFLDEGEASMIGVAGQKRVPDDRLRDLTVPIRDLHRQRAIADYLDAETARIDALIEKKQRMVELLVERRMTVMTDGVAGRFTSDSVVPSSLYWLLFRGTSWREVKLTLVARLGSGHTPSRDHPEWWTDCTIPWITTGEVAQLRSDRIEFLFETREKISELGLANSAAELRPAGTVVLCRTASAGYSAIMGTDMATSQDFATWTCGSLLRPRFLLICLRAMRQDLLGRLAMGSTHKTIYMPDIESLRIPLPDLSEQDAIVDAVWARLRQSDTLMDRLTHQIGLLQERRAALITAGVLGGIALAGDVA